MAYILSIETSTQICSVALHKENVCIDYIDNNEANSHSQKLTVLIEDILKKNNLKILDLDAIAISEGPGSYTGLRIGASVAKGVCYGANLPLIAVNTLEAYYLQGLEVITLQYTITDNDIFMPMIDARRMEVYTAAYNSKGKNLTQTHALIVSDETKNKFDKNKRFFLYGDGSSKLQETLDLKNIHFINNILPSAKSIGDIAYSKFTKKEFVDMAYFEPDYLKEFQTIAPKQK